MLRKYFTSTGSFSLVSPLVFSGGIQSIPLMMEQKKRYTIQTCIVKNKVTNNQLPESIPKFHDLSLLNSEILDSTNVIKHSSLSFDSFDKLTTFVEMIFDRFNLYPEIITNMDYEQSTTKKTKEELVRVCDAQIAMIIKDIPLELKKPEYKNIDKIISCVKASTLKQAQKLARIDLAERLYRCLDLGDDFTKKFLKKQKEQIQTKEQDSSNQVEGKQTKSLQNQTRKDSLIPSISPSTTLLSKSMESKTKGGGKEQNQNQTKSTNQKTKEEEKKNSSIQSSKSIPIQSASSFINKSQNEFINKEELKSNQNSTILHSISSSPSSPISISSSFSSSPSSPISISSSISDSSISFPGTFDESFNEKQRRFKDINDAANYISHISNLYALSSVKVITEPEYSLPSSSSSINENAKSLNTNNPIIKKSKKKKKLQPIIVAYKTTNILQIPSNLFKSQFSHLQEITSFSRETTVKEAKRRARMNLAEKLFESIDNPIEERGGKSSLNSPSNDPSISSLANKQQHSMIISLRIGNHTRSLLRNSLQNIKESNLFEEKFDYKNDSLVTNNQNYNSHEIDKNSINLNQSTSSNSSSSNSINSSFNSPCISDIIDSLAVPEELNNSLSIHQKYKEIIKEIENHQVTIISAATGSGKTTQIPQYLLAHYLNLKKNTNQSSFNSSLSNSSSSLSLSNSSLSNPYIQSHSPSSSPPRIVVTQPRRIAAKSVAQRIAYERRENIGSSVGYSVRFDSNLPKRMENGSILVCTSGILLKKLMSDPLLYAYSHLILDEVHERDVFTDLLLLTTKKLLKERNDLKVILMSATLQSNKLRDYYLQDGFKVSSSIALEGTNFPITNYYLEDIVEMIDGNPIMPMAISPETTKYIDQELSLTFDSDLMNDTESISTIPFIKPSSSSSSSSSSDSIMDSLKISHRDLEHIPSEYILSLISHIIKREIGGNGESRSRSRNEKIDGNDSLNSLNSFNNLNGNDTKGAILCFLPGLEEINVIHEGLMSGIVANPSLLQVYILHSTIPIRSTDEIFNPPPNGMIKIILATNIAESSITIKDVAYVIDSGKQKIMNYDQKHRMNMLEMCWSSQANIKQRLGRAGRCQPGKYYLLMSRRRVDRLPLQTPPELLRLGLDEVCLGLRSTASAKLTRMRMNNNSNNSSNSDSNSNSKMNSNNENIEIASVKCEEILSSAIDPPPRESIRSAVARLQRIKAIDENENLTTLGSILAELPLAPSVGRMLVYGVIFKCLGPMLTIVSSIGERMWKPLHEDRDKFDVHALIKIISNLGNERRINETRMEEGEIEIENENVNEMLKGGSEQLSDHLFYEKLFNIYRNNPNDPIINKYSHIISFSALKRIEDIRRQLKNVILTLFRYHSNSNSNSNSNFQRDNNDGSRGERMSKRESRGIEGEGDYETLFNSNRNNSNLLRFIITAGFYPDLAIRQKKNSYRLKLLKNIRPSGSSAIYNLGAKTLSKYMTRDDHYDRGYNRSSNNQEWNNNHGRYYQMTDRYSNSNNNQNENQNNKYINELKEMKYATYVVYEELIDIGGKLIARNTAIDPLFLPLFGDKIIVKRDHLILDDWLKIYNNEIENNNQNKIENNNQNNNGNEKIKNIGIKNNGMADGNNNHDSMQDLNILSELRIVLDDYLQFKIGSYTREMTLEEEKMKLVKEFENALLCLIEETNVFREPISPLTSLTLK